MSFNNRNARGSSRGSRGSSRGGPSRGDRPSTSSASASMSASTSTAQSHSTWSDRDRPALAASSWRSSAPSATSTDTPAAHPRQPQGPGQGQPASWASAIRGTHDRTKAAAATTAPTASSTQLPSDPEMDQQPTPASSSMSSSASPPAGKVSAWANGPPASVTSSAVPKSGQVTTSTAGATARAHSPKRTATPQATAATPSSTSTSTSTSTTPSTSLKSAMAAVSLAAAQPLTSWADQDDDEMSLDAAHMPAWAKELSALPVHSSSTWSATAASAAPPKKDDARTRSPGVPLVGGPKELSQALQGFFNAAAAKPAARHGDDARGMTNHHHACDLQASALELGAGEAAGHAHKGAANVMGGPAARFSKLEAETVLRKRVQMAREDEGGAHTYVPPTGKPASSTKQGQRARSQSPARARSPRAPVGYMHGGRVAFLSQLRRAIRNAQPEP